MQETGIQEKLNSALQYHQSGLLGDAKNLYEEVLRLDSNNLNALYLLGMIYYQIKQYDTAAEYLNKAVSINPAPDIYKILGDVYFEKSEIKNAIVSYQKAIELNPQLVEVYFNLGVAAYLEKDYQSSIRYYKQAIELKPDYTEVYTNLGTVYLLENNYEDAINNFNTSVLLNPNNANVYYNLGNAYRGLEKLPEAKEYYLKSLELKPDDPEIYFNLGLIAYISKDFDSAVESYLKALELKPDYVKAYNNLGLALFYKYDIDNAITCYKRALEIDPNDAGIYNNLGKALKEKNDLENAISCYEKALELSPDNSEFMLNLGHAYLLTKNYEKGFEYFEKRFYQGNEMISRLPGFSQPVWDGRSLENKTILVIPEQGFGDTLQFARFIPLLKYKGAEKILFKPQHGLEKLLRQSDLKAEILDNSVSYENINFDTFIPVMSLPYALRISADNIPYSEGYLKADKDKVNFYKENYFNNESFKVGIVWKTNVVTFKHAFNLIPHLSNFAGISKIPDVRLYSIQKGEVEEELNELPDGMEVTNLGQTFNDFADTAAAIENLDLLITIDTSVAHLSGGLGKKTWILLPYAPNWRWHLDCDDSPWYKSARLFRQTKPCSWDDVLIRVEENLINLVNIK